MLSPILQLNMAKDSETVLVGFLEGPLKFPPTYKFDVGTDTYDTRFVVTWGGPPCSSLTDKFYEMSVLIVTVLTLPALSIFLSLSGKKRKPAWTDRILWRLRATAPFGQAPNAGKRGSVSGLSSGTKVTQHFYRSHMEYMVSDHKPVSSIFTLQVRHSPSPSLSPTRPTCHLSCDMHITVSETCNKLG